MTKKTYACNFCGWEAQKNDVDVRLFGVLWVGNDALKHQSCLSCENHICIKCLQAIAEIEPKIRESFNGQ